MSTLYEEMKQFKKEHRGKIYKRFVDECIRYTYQAIKEDKSGVIIDCDMELVHNHWEQLQKDFEGFKIETFNKKIIIEWDF